MKPFPTLTSNDPQALMDAINQIARIRQQDISDNVNLQTVGASARGYAPASPSDATKYLNGAATPAYANVKDSDLSLTDITTNNVTTSAHGFVLKAPNDITKFFRGDATWAAIAGGSSVVTIKHQNFISSGTYTPSTGMLFCIARGIAGGGGGGSITANANAWASGGGAGSYSEVLLTAAQIGASKTVTIGPGGAAATNGTATSLGSLLTTNGGGAGQSASATPTSGTQLTGGAGGATGTGDFVIVGSAGDSAWFGSTLTNAKSGAGANSIWGNGGVANYGSGAAGGNAATGFGAGGGGAQVTIQSGGAGSQGVLTILEFCSQ